MKYSLKIVAWFWIAFGLFGLYPVCKGMYTDFIYTDGLIFFVILFILCGVGLLKRNVFAWWSIVVVSAMLVIFGIFHLIMGTDNATGIAPSVSFIILFGGCLAVMLMNKPQQWRLDQKSDDRGNWRMFVILYVTVFIGVTAMCIINMHNALVAGANENVLHSMPDITIPFSIMYIQILFAIVYAIAKGFIMLFQRIQNNSNKSR